MFDTAEVVPSSKTCFLFNLVGTMAIKALRLRRQVAEIISGTYSHGICIIVEARQKETSKSIARGLRSILG